RESVIVDPLWIGMEVALPYLAERVGGARVEEADGVGLPGRGLRHGELLRLDRRLLGQAAYALPSARAVVLPRHVVPLADLVVLHHPIHFFVAFEAVGAHRGHV